MCPSTREVNSLPFLFLLPLFASLVTSFAPAVDVAGENEPSDSSSSIVSSPYYSRDGGAASFYAGEVRQNANLGSIPRRHRYAHVRRTWLAARERTARGRRLERLQSDDAAAAVEEDDGDKTGGSGEVPPVPAMFMVEAKPIKKSIDDLQAIVLKQSSQGYKDMLRALMVSFFSFVRFAVEGS